MFVRYKPVLNYKNDCELSARTRYGQGQQRTERVRGLWRRAAFCRGRTQPGIEQNKIELQIMFGFYTVRTPVTRLLKKLIMSHLPQLDTHRSIF